ncbi:MAG TPA: hypothetical protein VEO54_09320 [Thermoanaerobaculia bacterium]|nr:hypothetical protein [Thermoanaerobaculia bacterium]
MNYRWYLLLVLVGLVLFATPSFAEGTTIPIVITGNEDDPGITETCFVCKGSYDPATGEHRVWCGKPASGGWGHKQCEVNTYEDQFACISYGDGCCVS